VNKKVDYVGYTKLENIHGVITTETGEIYVQVIWSGKDYISYNEKMVVGEDTLFRFPGLPTSNVEIRLSHEDPSNGAANIMATIIL